MIGVIFLNYNERKDADIAFQSVINPLNPYPLIEVKRKGIANAINYGMNSMFSNVDVQAVMICANDIIMPKHWDFWINDALHHIPNTGAAAIHCVEKLPEIDTINGYRVRPSWGVFGNTCITRKAFETIGYFNEDHDPYGMQDSDYCYRLHKAGFDNYYLADLSSQHVGHDVGDGTPYRAMKDEGLSVAGQKFNQWQKIYDQGYLYLPFDQSIEIISQQQYEGE